MSTFTVYCQHILDGNLFWEVQVCTVGGVPPAAKCTLIDGAAVAAAPMSTASSNRVLCSVGATETRFLA